MTKPSFIIKLFALLSVFVLITVFSACGIITPMPEPTDSPDVTHVQETGISYGEFTDVVFNEVVSTNSLCHIDPKLGAADWIEFYNKGAKPVDLGGVQLGDSVTFLNGLKFPEGTVIEAGGYLTVYCISGFSGGADELVAPFGIARAGEKLYLSASSRGSISCDVPFLSTDVSYARRDDGTWGYSASPTFGAANVNISSTLEEAESGITVIDALHFSEIVTGSSGWAELKNTSGAAVNLSYYSLSDNPENPTKWRFPDMELESGEYVVVELNDIDSESPLTANFKVSRTETGIYLYNNISSEADRMELEPNIPDGVSAVVTADGVMYTCFITKGAENSDITFPHVEWTPMDPAASPLIINEVCANNKYGIVDSYGDRSDWVELWNTTDDPVYLSGYYISDDAADPLKYRLPNVALLPKTYVVIFLSGKASGDYDGEIHAPFKLSNGESIYLSTLDGMKQDCLLVPEELIANASVGRGADNEVYYYAAPTPGEPNSTYGFDKAASILSFDPNSVYISEVSAVSAARSGGTDWIELVNCSSKDMKLTGWSLTDDPAVPRKLKLDNTFIEAGGYAALNLSLKTFTVSNCGDAVFLVSPEGAFADVFYTGMTTVGVTSGRAERSQTGERCFFTKATKGYKNGTPVSGYVHEPVITYRDSTLTIKSATENAVIRYTTDGSNPTESSKQYTSPLTVTETTVIKAKAFSEGLISSPVAVRTVLIGENTKLPIVCLSMSSSDYSRMYTATMSPRGGVTKGDEVPCFMEYYINNKLAISSGAGVRVSGASTAMYSQKSLGLYFRAGYGRSSLDYPLFDGCSVTSFRSLTLRNGGQDAYYARIRDAFMSRICQGLEIDVAYYRPVLVFINGKYRGIYDMKENMNEDYVAAHHNVARSTVEIMKRNGYVLAGNDTQWMKMRKMCQTLDFSLQENYDKLAKIVDVDSIIDYLIARTYFYDGDMFNQKYWHTNDDKVKWRAVFYDSDFALYGNNAGTSILSAYFNKNGVSSAHGFITNMDIYCALNQNKAWREKFITRYIWAVKYRFNKDRAVKMFDELVALYRPEMQRQINRWHMPKTYSGWEEEIDALRSCLKKRPEKALRNLKNFYGISDSKWAEYEKAADKMAGK